MKITPGKVFKKKLFLTYFQICRTKHNQRKIIPSGNPAANT